MRTNLPTYQTIYASWGGACEKVLYYRQYPNPNQDGSPGTLPDLSSALFKASLLDMFDTPLASVPSFAGYWAGATGGKVTLTLPQAIVEAVDPGTYRYRVSMSVGGGLYLPVWSGPFIVSGDAEQVVIAEPGESTDGGLTQVTSYLGWGP